MPFKVLAENPDNYTFSKQQAVPQTVNAQQEAVPTESSADLKEPGFEMRAGPTALEELGQIATSTALAPLELGEGIVGLAGKGLEYLGAEPLDRTYPRLSELIRSKLPGKLGQTPASFLGRVFNTVGGNWPLAVFGGLRTLGAVGSEIAGAAGLHLAEDLGLGPVGMVAGSILGSAGFKNFGQLLKKGKTPGRIAQLESKMYDRARTVGAKERVAAAPVHDTLVKALDNAKQTVTKEHGFTEAAKTNLINNLNTIIEKLPGGKINGAALIDTYQDLNRAYRNLPEIEHILGTAKSGIKDVMSEIGHRAPAYEKWFKTATEIHKAMTWQGPFLNLLTKGAKSGQLGALIKNPKTGYLVASLIGVGSYLPSSLRKALGLGATAAVGAGAGAELAIRGGKIAAELLKTKVGQKLLFEITAQSAKDSYSGLLRSIKAVDRHLSSSPEEKVDLS